LALPFLVAAPVGAKLPTVAKELGEADAGDAGVAAGVAVQDVSRRLAPVAAASRIGR
jgi:hypothetical protein